MATVRKSTLDLEINASKAMAGAMQYAQGADRVTTTAMAASHANEALTQSLEKQSSAYISLANAYKSHYGKILSSNRNLTQEWNQYTQAASLGTKKVTEDFSALNKEYGRHAPTSKQASALMTNQVGIMGQLSSSVKAVAAGYISLRFAISVSSRALEESAASEMATLRLNQALKLQGETRSESIRGIQQYAEILSRVSMYTTNDIKTQMSHGLAMGVSADNIKLYTTAAEGLANAIGTDLSTAFRMLTMAERGSFEMLRRHCIMVSETASDYENFYNVMLRGIEGFQESLNNLDSQAMAWKQMKAEILSASEELGVFLYKLTQPKAWGDIIAVLNDIPSGNFDRYIARRDSKLIAWEEAEKQKEALAKSRPKSLEEAIGKLQEDSSYFKIYEYLDKERTSLNKTGEARSRAIQLIDAEKVARKTLGPFAEEAIREIRVEFKELDELYKQRELRTFKDTSLDMSIALGREIKLIHATTSETKEMTLVWQLHDAAVKSGIDTESAAFKNMESVLKRQIQLYHALAGAKRADDTLAVINRQARQIGRSERSIAIEDALRSSGLLEKGQKFDQAKAQQIVNAVDRQYNAKAGYSLDKSIERIQIERDLLGMSNREREKQTMLMQATEGMDKASIAANREKFDQLDHFIDSYQRQAEQMALAKDIQGELTNGLRGMIRTLAEGGDAWDAMGNIALNVLDRILQKQLEEAITAQSINALISGFTGGIGGLFGGGGGGYNYQQIISPPKSAKGNVFQNGSIVPFGRGGIITGPTMFPMFGGRMGIAGEGGKEEGILPLKRGRSGTLGVEVTGQQKQAPIIVQSPAVKVVNVNVLDPSVVSDYMNSSAGERLVLNVMRRNRGVLNG